MGANPKKFVNTPETEQSSSLLTNPDTGSDRTDLFPDGFTDSSPTTGIVERQVAGHGYSSIELHQQGLNPYQHAGRFGMVVDEMEHPRGLGFDGMPRYNRASFYPNMTPMDLEQHRGELSANEKYRYDLSKSQLKATSRTSALLAGFAMVALVELQYEDTTNKALLVFLGVITTLLVSVHLIALMVSTCLIPHLEANGCSKDSPHNRLHFYIELSWLFSTCIGLLLFLVEIGVIFFVKFSGIGFIEGAYITTAILIPVFIAFVVISYKIHGERFLHSVDRVDNKMANLENIIEGETHANQALQKQIIQMGLARQV